MHFSRERQRRRDFGEAHSGLESCSSEAPAAGELAEAAHVRLQARGGAGGGNCGRGGRRAMLLPASLR